MRILTMRLGASRTFRAGSLATVVLTLLLGACTVKHAGEASPDPAPRHAACVLCHRTTAPEESPAVHGLDPSEVCLDCHHYRENHHPVGIAPGPDYGPLLAAARFPLHGGTMTCLTCHEAHRGKNFAESPRLLRGGPYSHTREICLRCHQKEQYAEKNPHLMLDRSGEVRSLNGAPVCLFCHVESPVRDGAAGAARFRADIAFLCWRCHPPMEPGFLKSHFHVTPARETLQTMRLTEEQRTVILPLARDGMMTCSTCHNPHQAGVILHGPAGAGSDSPGKLRLARETICSGCHRIQ